MSVATISKVLNGHPDVAAPTRARVEEHLALHGYTRRGSRQQARFIELVFRDLEPSWSVEVIDGVEKVTKASGLSVVLTVGEDNGSPGTDWLEGVLQRRPLGVVLVISDLPLPYRDKLRSRGIPFVIIDPGGDPAPDEPAVGSTNWDGGLIATRHLIELGHRRIAMITGPEDMMCSHARVDGYRSAMSTAGLEIDPAWIRYGDFHPTGGDLHARELLALPEPPTAIFAGSDLQAFGVIAAATQAGLRVPDDLSVVGYDDISLSRWMNPPLTTVHQPLRLMAETATRLVVRLAAGETPETLRMDLATQLVVRGSTAPLV